MATKILVVTPFDETEWTWFGGGFGDGAYAWEFRNLALFGKRPWAWLAAAWRVAREAPAHDLLITHHPYMTFYLALALKLARVAMPHYAFSFNHGNGRFFRGLMRKLAVEAFREVRGFVVYSQQEKRIYGDYYRIPRERFSFSHWAVQPPDVGGEQPAYLERLGPYVCCMGRNNRDFELFLEAVRELGVPAVVVSKTGRLDPRRMPSNVMLRCDIPEKEAFQILARSVLSVVPLKDASTGAGHITVVTAMQLGIPQVITRLPTVSDYFVDGTHGLFVEPGSKASLREAIARVWSQPEERRRMSEAARAFADRWLCEDASRRHLQQYLEAIVGGGVPGPVPPGWPDPALAASHPGEDGGGGAGKAANACRIRTS
jgi:glycosyltransferase involved in cell wall biosynthesis